MGSFTLWVFITTKKKTQKELILLSLYSILHINHSSSYWHHHASFSSSESRSERRWPRVCGLWHGVAGTCQRKGPRRACGQERSVGEERFSFPSQVQRQTQLSEVRTRTTRRARDSMQSKSLVHRVRGPRRWIQNREVSRKLTTAPSDMEIFSQLPFLHFLLTATDKETHQNPQEIVSEPSVACSPLLLLLPPDPHSLPAGTMKGEHPRAGVPA